jgi:membrane protein YqaA with SNARE-associated domain
MFDWSGETGLAALFAAAFVSATFVPANSELVLAAVVRAAPANAALAVAIATLGNTLGGLTTYALGRLVPERTVPRGRGVELVRRYGRRQARALRRGGLRRRGLVIPSRFAALR